MACSKGNDCILPLVVQTQIGMYAYGGDTIREDTSLEKASLCLNDTALCYFFNQAIPNKFSLLFNPNVSRQEYVLTDSASAIMDTMEIFYTPKLSFISNDCGYQYFYDLDSTKFTGALIDSVKIMNDEITDERNKEHIEIILK